MMFEEKKQLAVNGLMLMADTLMQAAKKMAMADCEEELIHYVSNLEETWQGINQKND
ncbi:MAG: hypothetical protein OXR68_00140 [Alphaproteobacteria bacterium]|nr:hypothetical protein [Alphaproteobacteria bacterium]MDD9919020.1 hypothetical protein [Alphaproteobacteria bacterium]